MSDVNSQYEHLEPPQQEGELGRLGPYRVHGVVGSGGMGEVFRAQDVRLKRTVALKLMKPKLATTPASRKRFVEEARSMAAIHHDNVATIFEVGIHGGVPFMAMELLHGEPLNKVMQRQQKFETVQVLRLAKEVSMGLTAAHQCGIVHRDIKPANIWVEESTGRAKILDFGLAIAGNSFDPFTARGVVVGSPGFLSPEQARNDPLDDRTDLYSLGVVLYTMCAGKLPLSTGTISGQLVAILCERPRSLSKLNPDTPQPLCDLIHQLLEKEARQRPASAQQLEQRIDDIAAHCATESHKALQIVTETPNEKPIAPSAKRKSAKRKGAKRRNSKQKESSPAESRPKPNFVLLGAVSAGSLLVLAAVIWWFTKPDRVASQPARVVATAPEKKVQQVTAASLQPLSLASGSGGTRRTVSGEAARYRLRLSNDAQDAASDPRRVNADAKVTAQIVTLLKQEQTSRVQRPTFPKKITVSQLPRPGESREIEIQFLTNNLPAGSYEVAFELQSPDGAVIATISESLEVQENLQESDLLGFELLRTHHGRGADTFVRKGSKEDNGGAAILQGLHQSQAKREQIYLRFDLSKLPKPEKEIDRVILLLTVHPGGQQGNSSFAVYGITDGLDPNWDEQGHLTWETSPCRDGVGGQKYLGNFSLDNAKDRLKDVQDGVRFFGDELDDFIRNAESDQITLVLIRESSSNKATRFKSKEGKPKQAPALAIREPAG